MRALIKRTDILFTLDKLRPFITHAHIRRIQQIIIPRHASIIMTRPWYIMIGFLNQKLINHLLIDKSAPESSILIKLWDDFVLDVGLGNPSPVDGEGLSGVVIELHAWHLN